MRKVVALTLGFGIVTTAFVASAQMQMPRHGQMPMQMDMAEHGQMHRGMMDAMAGHGAMEHGEMTPMGQTPGQLAALPPTAAAPVSVNAEVVRVDQETGRITLRHEAIPNLDMRAMTMVFRLTDPSLADGLAAGDRVAFEADRVGGVMTVTKLTKAAN